MSNSMSTWSVRVLDGQIQATQKKLAGSSSTESEKAETSAYLDQLLAEKKQRENKREES